MLRFRFHTLFAVSCLHTDAAPDARQPLLWSTEAFTLQQSLCIPACQGQSQDADSP